MASTAAVLSPPSPKPSTSDVDDDDEDYEIVYEEIEEEIEVEEEVEIEVEVEEEIEEEADHVETGGKDEIGEELTAASRQEIPKCDTGTILELDEHKDHVQPSSLTEEVFVKCIGDVKTTESNSKEEYVTGEKISENNYQKALLNDSGEVHHAKITPSIGDVNATSIMNDASEKNVNAIESNQSALDDVGNTSPRLHASQIRFRDPLPSSEFGRESKKLRIVCEFHAKGWCIRGNSCRFLHTNDGPDAVMKKTEELGWEASSSACVPPLQSEDDPKLNTPKDDTYMGAPALEDRGRFRHSFYLDNYRYYSIPPLKGHLSARDSPYHGSSSMVLHDNDNRVSDDGPRMDEIFSKKSNTVPIDHRLSDLSESYSRHPLPFGSSSQNTSAHGLHNFLQSSLDHLGYVSPSMQRSIPLGSHSESDTLSRNRSIREADAAKSAKSETAFSSLDWEPSLPFRPSHEITRRILLKESLYNPVHESIDKKDGKDIGAKFSNSDQGSSIKNVNVKSKSPQGEVKLLDKVLGGDTGNDNLLSCRNYKVKHDETMDETVVKGYGSGTKDDTDGHFKRADHVTHLHSESKAFKYFQSALIEFVKEIVKPTWREGLLSKDAHKLIVKKAVDKVLSTLPTHQIPSTAESVKLYLSACQPKLAKLVEGYIGIYGKT